MKVGDYCIGIRTATKEVVQAYAEISGDYNPIHLDEKYAKKSVFRKCIAHGLFCLGEISKLIANELPGPGAILINEKLNYRSPVYIDDVITTEATIINITKKSGVIELKVKCTNQNEKIVLDGTTLVKMDKKGETR